MVGDAWLGNRRGLLLRLRGRGARLRTEGTRRRLIEIIGGSAGLAGYQGRGIREILLHGPGLIFQRIPDEFPVFVFLAAMEDANGIAVNVARYAGDERA